MALLVVEYHFATCFAKPSVEKLSLAFSCVDLGTFSIIASLAIRMNEMDRVLRDRIQEFDLRKVTNLMQAAKVWFY